MDWMTDRKTFNAVLGLASAVNCIVETLVAKRAIDSDDLRRLLEQKEDQLRSGPGADGIDQANVLPLILGPLQDPDRAALREFLEKPPRGQA